MHRIIMCLLFFCVSIQLDAQESSHDISMTVQLSDEKGPVLIPWYLYTSDDVVLETRYGFDSPRIAAGFVGKYFPTFTGFSFIPMIGFLTGEGYTGLSIQTHIDFERDPVLVSSMNQYSFGINESPSFIYHSIEAQYSLNASTAFGIGEELSVWNEDEVAPEFGLGPVIEFIESGFYGRVWNVYSIVGTGGNRVYFTLGYQF